MPAAAVIDSVYKAASRLSCLLIVLCALASASWAQDVAMPEEAALLRQAEQQCAHGDYARAVAGYDAVLQRNHFQAAAYLGRGLAYLGLGNGAQALVDCSAAIHLAPKNTLAYVSRARVYARQGKYAFAIADCTTALRLDGRQGAAYATRGWAYAASGKYRAAIADCTTAIHLNAHDGAAYATRAWAYRKTGRLTRAHADDDAAEILATPPGDASSFDHASFLGPDNTCVVDFTLGGYLIFVHVRIGDAPTDYNFVVDTGADTNVISQELAAGLQLKTLREQTTTDAGGATGTVAFTTLDALTLGSCRLRHALVVATDLRELSYDAGRKIDGILGDNFLRHYRVAIDYARHRLTFSRTVEPLSGRYLITADAAQPFRALAVPIIVDGQPLSARIDTGAVDIALPRTLLQQLQYPRTETLSSSGALAAGLWGLSPENEILVRLKELQLGEFHLHHYPAASLCCDFGVLGEEFLAQFLVTIDYPTRTVAFTPVAHPVFKTNLFAAGLGGLPLKQDGLRISGIWDNSPAAKAGIHPGDRIRAINGNTDEEAIVQLLRHLRTDDAITQIDLLLESAGVQRRVTLKKDWLFPPVSEQ